MAKAKSCDRCGQFYIKNNNDSGLIAPHSMQKLSYCGIGFYTEPVESLQTTLATDVELIHNYNKIPKCNLDKCYYELCDDCISQILDFIKNGKDKKQ